MSRTEFPLPKGCAIENINLDVENNLLTVIYGANDKEGGILDKLFWKLTEIEEEKPVLEVGEWWYHSTGVLNLIVEVNESMKTVKCIPTYGLPKSGGFSFHGICTMTHKADMTKVKALLIGEAEKMGFKEGVVVLSALNNTENRLNDCKPLFDYEGLRIGGSLVFNGKTGRWAEIVNKPLYVNQYGTEFFEGDEYHFVVKNTLRIGAGSVDGLPTESFNESKINSEIMTHRECHQYISENWDKLNK